MPQNDFLPWATGTNPNVLDQTAYLNLSTRPGGAEAGRASGQQANKTWRQTSIISAMLGQFINDVTGDDAIDDGTTATLEQSLIKAVRGVGATYAQDTGTANTIVAALSPAPPSQAALVGVPLRIRVAQNNNGLAAPRANLNGFGAKSILTVDGNVPPPYAMRAGGIAKLVYDGTNYQLVNPATPTPQYVLAHGQCRLLYSSATQILLRAWDGSNLIVSGVQRQIPLGNNPVGIVAGNTTVRYNGADNQNLPANATLYVAAYVDTTGTPRLAYFNKASYSHAPDTTIGNVGVEVITQGGSPLSSYTLVGMVQTNGSAQFQHDGLQFNGVLSWFKRHKIVGSWANPSTEQFSQTVAGVIPTYTIGFLTWADSGITFGGNGNTSSSVVGAQATYAANIDNATSGTTGAFSIYYATSGSYGYCVENMFAAGIMGDGWHTLYLIGLVSAGLNALINVIGSQNRMFVETFG